MATNHASKLFGSLLGEGQESPKVKKDVAFGVGSDEPWYFPSPKSESESVKRVAFRFEMERNGDKFQWVLVGFDVKFPRTHLCKVAPYDGTSIPAQDQDKNLFIAEAEDRYGVKLYPVKVEGDETWYFPNLPQEQALAAADVVAALSEAGASATAHPDCVVLRIRGAEIRISHQTSGCWGVQVQHWIDGQWRCFRDRYGLSLADAIRHVASQMNALGY